jgi:hypothetical protein
LEVSEGRNICGDPVYTVERPAPIEDYDEVDVATYLHRESLLNVLREDGAEALLEAVEEADHDGN